MMERAFRLYDASILVTSRLPGEDRIRLPRNDWETFNRLMSVLVLAGFDVGEDPWITSRWRSLSNQHRLGRRETPHGPLFVVCEVYPTGCHLKFFQEVVTVNKNGGRFDFDKREKMPYLIGKAFEAALRRIRAHLLERGFTETISIESPNPDPLAWFNAHWDSEYERRRGTHRFERGPDGWPTEREVVCGYPGRIAHPHGALRYYRDRSGRLKRGRVYGGINGQWTVIHGPGRRDVDYVYCTALFEQPPAGPRRLHPGRAKRLAAELAAAVARQDFERAIVLRDVLRRSLSGPEMAEAA